METAGLGEGVAQRDLPRAPQAPEPGPRRISSWFKRLRGGPCKGDDMGKERLGDPGHLQAVIADHPALDLRDAGDRLQARDRREGGLVEVDEDIREPGLGIVAVARGVHHRARVRKMTSVAIPQATTSAMVITWAFSRPRSRSSFWSSAFTRSARPGEGDGDSGRRR